MESEKVPPFGGYPKKELIVFTKDELGNEEIVVIHDPVKASIAFTMIKELGIRCFAETNVFDEIIVKLTNEYKTQ